MKTTGADSCCRHQSCRQTRTNPMEGMNTIGEDYCQLEEIEGDDGHDDTEGLLQGGPASSNRAKSFSTTDERTSKKRLSIEHELSGLSDPSSKPAAVSYQNDYIPSYHDLPDADTTTYTRVILKSRRQFEVPCTLAYFTSLWGLENVQLYFWILKDLSWLDAAIVPGYVAAVVIVLGMVLVYMSRSSFSELVMALASLLWILGNWWWMIGENWNHRFHDSDEGVLAAHELQARYLLLGAFVMAATYYFVHLPLKKLRGYINFRFHQPQGVPEDLEGKDPILVPDIFPVRFPLLFDDWRDWANLEVLFWTGKDLFWSLQWRVPWAMCAVATLMHTADMLYVTWPLRIENCHKWAQLIWVAANVMWAYGELFEPFKDHSVPENVYEAPSDWRNLRWWAFWFLWSAFVPIISLYASWIPVTLHADGQCACQSHNNDEILTTIEASMSMAMDEGHPLDANNPLLLKSEPLDDKEPFLFCFHSLDETSECWVNPDESVDDVEI